MQQLTIRTGHGLTRLGGAQPPAARQRAAERRLRGRRASAESNDAAVGAGLRRWSSTSGSSARSPSITPSRRSTPTTIAACSIASREQAAAVIYNSIVFEQTQEDSLTDPLTGLPNTRFMFMHLTRELARAERLKSEVSLLVMDLDNFKDINDTYGHHVGDRALRDVAARAARRASARTTSASATPATSSSSCCRAAAARKPKRKRARAAAHGRSSCCSRPGPARRCRSRISIGAAIFPHDGESYETLLATADSRMYRDKTRRKQRAGQADRPATGTDGRSRRSRGRHRAIGIRSPQGSRRSGSGGSCRFGLALRHHSSVRIRSRATPISSSSFGMSSPARRTAHEAQRVGLVHARNQRARRFGLCEPGHAVRPRGSRSDGNRSRRSSQRLELAREGKLVGRARAVDQRGVPRRSATGSRGAASTAAAQCRCRRDEARSRAPPAARKRRRPTSPSRAQRQARSRRPRIVDLREHVRPRRPRSQGPSAIDRACAAAIAQPTMTACAAPNANRCARSSVCIRGSRVGRCRTSTLTQLKPDGPEPQLHADDVEAGVDHQHLAGDRRASRDRAGTRAASATSAGSTLRRSGARSR